MPFLNLSWLFGSTFICSARLSVHMRVFECAACHWWWHLRQSFSTAQGSSSSFVELALNRPFRGLLFQSDMNGIIAHGESDEFWNRQFFHSGEVNIEFRVRSEHLTYGDFMNKFGLGWEREGGELGGEVVLIIHTCTHIYIYSRMLDNSSVPNYRLFIQKNVGWPTHRGTQTHSNTEQPLGWRETWAFLCIGGVYHIQSFCAQTSIRSYTANTDALLINSSLLHLSLCSIGFCRTL